MGSFELGIVVAVYPEGNSVDVLIPDTGSRLSNVQVMNPFASENTGILDLPDPGLPTDDSRWNILDNPGRYLRAVVGSYRGNIPFVFGFIFPQECQMTFQQKNRYINRHASDVYTTIDGAGNTELYHPSGTYFRIGTNSAHEDLTGADYDQRWKIKNNTATAPHVHLTVANAGVVKTTIDIDSGGHIVITSSGNLDVTAPQLNVTASGGITLNNVTIDSQGNLTSPKTITGQTEVVAKTGGSAVHLSTHTTPNIQRAGATSDPPTPGS